MQCPDCQTINKDGSKFCGGCGNKLSLICPSCSSENAPENHFCNDCGQNLALPVKPIAKELSFDEKLGKIQKYLPKGLTEKILAQRDRIEGERKQITVMFCDMEDFTAFSDKLGPERAYNTMDKIYEILIHKVHDYEGTVNEMTGDGIMALFGAPIALEDAPQRAIRSSLAIHREMAKFTDEMKNEKSDMPTIKMRVGIHTGPVVLGTMGNDLRVDFKAVGDTVNMASRMEGLAAPGATYVTESTFKNTEGFFRFEALGEKNVKGKKEPIRTYRVIAPSSRRTRFDVNAEQGLTPLVGRARELELLHDGLERSKTGRGQALSIIAEAGIGKSRLLYEFIKEVTNENVTILEGKCLSYSRGVAYHPVIDILKSNFDIKESDQDLEIKSKVQRGLKVLGADEALTLPYLLELLSVKDSGIKQIPMSPEGKKDRILKALKRIVITGSEIRPLVMVIEDLHWADRSTEDSLKNLLENISGAKVLLIFTYRPEFIHTWGSKSYLSQITLNRLSNRESLQMVYHILGTGEIDKNVEDLIIEKTEGVPFFVEEFVKSLKELKIIQKKRNIYFLSKGIGKMTIPSTIHDVVMARVDSLPEGAKEVLKVGAAIEREFDYALIKNSTGLPEEELLTILSVLKDAEILYERGIYPKSTYIFKHALTREVVYDSILEKQKRMFHKRIGGVIEELYREKIDENCVILAEHFIRGRDYAKGAEHCKLAARKAVKSASLNDAISIGKKRITCLENLQPSEEKEKEIIDARTNLGLYYVQLSYLVKAYEAVSSIVELALKHNYEKRLSQIYTIIGTYYFGNKGDVPTGLHYLDKALKIAEKTNNFASLWMVHHWLGHALSDNCEFEQALYHLEKALEISQAANLTWSISIMKSCIANTVYNQQGNAKLGYLMSCDGIKLAEESGDIHSKSEAYVNNGVACYLKGLFDQADLNLTKGARYSTRLDLVQGSVADYFLGLIEMERNNYRRAREHFVKSVSAMKHRGFYPDGQNLITMMSIYAEIKEHEKDIDTDTLFRYVKENRIKLYEGLMYFWISKILGEMGARHLSSAVDYVEKAIKSHYENNLIWHLGMDYAWQAELFKKNNDFSNAKDKLETAIDFFEKCGADGWVEKAEKELALDE